MNPNGVRFRKRIIAGALLTTLIPPVVLSLSGQTNDIARMRSEADAQHQIVVILINKKDFAKAAEEANKIFQMKWPADLEPVLLEELLGFSDQFRHHGQLAIALKLLDTNSGFFKAVENKAEIMKDKGYVLQEMGQPDKALECFKEAQRLMKLAPPAKKKKSGDS